LKLRNSMNWLLLNSGRGSPAFNMAMDEALLEVVSRLRQPVLRFYGWTEPAATFGYFQKFAEVERTTLLRQLIRRPTGGGLVPHDADWTYSLAFPPGDEWYLLRAEESYRRVHEWLQAAFARMGVKTELAPCCKKSAPGQCFVGHEKHDLLWQGRKIAGAAQRRNKLGLLIQGSVQPPPLTLARTDWEQAMAAVAVPPAQWVDFTPDAGLTARVTELGAMKYCQTAYNRKR
jgi:lipoate-protein ligase A